MAAVLADFQSWLSDLAVAAVHDEAGGTPALRSAGVPPIQRSEETIDLHTLLGQFLAVRQEVNLQTRAVRAQQEQNAETLRQLTAALDALRQSQDRAESAPRDEDDATRPLLKTLLDLYDALALAGREIERMGETVRPALELLAAPAPEESAVPVAPRSFWRKWFSAPVPDPAAQAAQKERQRLACESSARVQQMLASLMTGYTMSVQRIARALRQHGLEAIPTAGERFDPERMEAVEAVADSGRPAGEVIDEIRRGYLWNGRVFRYAQVRVAKG